MTKDSRDASYAQSAKALQTQHAAMSEGDKRQLQMRDYFMAKARLDTIADFIRGGLDPRALTRFLLQDLSVNDALRACTPQSLFLGLLACAMTGLEPGPLKGHAYLIPYGKEATFVAGYKGLIVQARRSRVVTSISANVVHERDTFDIDLGTANRVVHRPLLTGERGKVIGAYAIATVVPPSFEGREVIDIDENGRARRGVGFAEIEWLDITELDKVKKSARGTNRADAPWNAWESEMQRKTAIRRLAKRLPLGDDYFRGLALDKPHDEGRFELAGKEQRKLIDLETEGKSERMIGDAPPGELTDEDKRAIEAEEAAEHSKP